LSTSPDFEILDTTIAAIHAAMRTGKITARGLVQSYLDRIDAYDRSGPRINSIIAVNPDALAEADRLDAEFASTGKLRPLHGIAIALKDQGDIAGMPTTMGSVLFQDHVPPHDAFAVSKLKEAGAVFIAKTTLGEFGAGDAHGSLFGSTRNVFDLERTSGGSSGGSGAAVSANFCTVAIGQEGFSSIRRPAAWNGVAGMRPTAGLVSRTGIYNGWPTINGALGPMARNVEDLARLLQSMIGYDPDDPLTAFGAWRTADDFTAALDRNALKGARLGVLRQSTGYASDPQSGDFRKVDDAFNRSLGELAASGAILVDPIEIKNLDALLATRARSEEEDLEAFKVYFNRTPNARFKTRQEAMASDRFQSVFKGAQDRWRAVADNKKHYEYLKARDLLMMHLLQVMAENNLDAIVHKAVEHQPTLIKDGLAPPFHDQKGAIHINTFLVFVPTVVVPAGFTVDNLPVGISFLGRPYDDAKMLGLAFAYEQATRHRVIPPLTR
jgi:amidase